MARFGDPNVEYSHKGIDKPVHAWPSTDYLTCYCDQIEELIGWRANCCVANTYTEDGDLFPHRDSQYIPQLGLTPTIVSLSFGQTREFLVWELDERGKRLPKHHAVRLAAGDVLVMEGEFDARFHHGIKPEPNRPGLRLSLTYRKHF
jgi:alkylated DNA repair dioxygenase AlkB